MLKYNIKGLKIDKKLTQLKSDDGCRCINYKCFLCRISIATDFFGTQICQSGKFFGPWGLRDIEEGVEYLREHRKEAIKFFRVVYIKSLKYKIPYYWDIRKLTKKVIK